jgi:tetratricopeptide (TPR) repeat protein
VKALGLLGQAYLHKQQTEWAEDVLRLGIQFGQELEAAGPLFGWLGKTRVETGRFGEAIGLLRRALALGSGTFERSELFFDLARCFCERKRFVAALACLDSADAAASPINESSARERSELRATVTAALGGAFERYRDVLGQPPS